jgi:molecular chaperone GrpE (heat shock protein)
VSKYFLKKMFRTFKRFYTAATAETPSEHLNKNAKFYGILITSVTLFTAVIWGSMRDLKTELKADINDTEKRLKADINDTEKRLKDDMKDLKTELKADIKEIKDLLAPMIVQAKVNTKRMDGCERSKN